METIEFRKANEADKPEIARILAESFREDFNLLTKNNDKVKRILVNSVDTARMFVATVSSQIAGTIALSSRDKRPFHFKTSDFVKELGWFRGGIGAQFLKKMFSVALPIPEYAGYIEFVAVDEKFRRRGIAELMLKGVIQLGDYREYRLDVVKDNEGAIRLYEKNGFRRLDIKDPAYYKLLGFPEKIYLTVAPDKLGCSPEP